MPAVQTLRTMWIQQFRVENERVRWRKPTDQPAAGRRLHSPYDPEAVCGTKRGQSWIGYKVHLTETCEGDQPHVITDVQTTSAAVTDNAMTAPIHRALAARQVRNYVRSLDPSRAWPACSSSSWTAAISRPVCW